MCVLLKYCYTHLQVNPVQLFVLVFHFCAHVGGHVPQVSDHGAHLLHVLLHLLFAVIIGDPKNKINAFFHTFSLQVSPGNRTRA